MTDQLLEELIRQKIDHLVAQKMNEMHNSSSYRRDRSPPPQGLLRQRNRSRSPQSRTAPIPRNWIPLQNTQSPPQHTQIPQYSNGPQPDYIPLNYSNSSNSSYSPRTNSHYEPPVHNYEPPNYKPPVHNYEPPVHNYEPLVHNYATTSSNYTSTSSNYVPPRIIEPDVREQMEPFKDGMGHRLITSLVTIKDFMGSIHNRKSGKISDDRISNIMKDLQRFHFLHPNKVIRIPDSYSYELYVYHISTKLGFPNCIFWCPNRHDFAVEKSGLLDKYSPIRMMIKDIEQVTNSCLVRIAKTWSDRNQSWTLQIDFKGTFTEAQINKLKNFVANLTK